MENLILIYDSIDKKWKKLEPELFQQTLYKLSGALREAKEIMHS
jgi:hypothetical protein